MPPSYSFDYARLRRYAGYTSLAIAATIACLSLVSNGALPSVSGSDKVKHFIAYAGLAAPMIVWLGARRVIWVIAMATAFGFGIEIIQGLMTAGRTPSLGDALANLLGAMFGAGAMWLVIRPRHRWRRPAIRFLPK